MKYYGKITDPKDLITQEKGEQIAETKIAAAIDPSTGTVQQKITTTNKLSADLVDDSSAANKFVSASDKTNWDSKEPGDATILKQANVVDNITTTTTNMPLSANQGKLLNDRINNLESMGRYLALWDCTTGKPTTNPTTMPYTYKAGDYYRVTTVGATNYKPDGSTYNDVASTVEETDSVEIGDVYFYDGTNWTLQINHIGGLVTDVTVDGTSVVSGGVAAITGKENTSNKVTSLSSSSTDTQYPSAKCVYDIVGNVETLLSQI